MLDGSNTALKNDKTADEESKDKDARMKLQIRALNDFVDEAKTAAIKMVQGKLP